MWSNLNESFSAISGHISTLRQSIPTFVENDQRDSNEERNYETKISLLQNEVIRHRDIALLYKDRWLKAEQVVKNSTGHQSEDYHDEINLLDDVPSIERESIDDQTIDIHDSNVKLTDEQRLPANITNLSLDSATIKIRSLEDEIRKIDIDRQHWHSLAKQKATIEEELEELRLQCENHVVELRKSSIAYAELAESKRELEVELQELDTQHEAALATVIRIRDDALNRAEHLERRLAEIEEEHKRKVQDDDGTESLLLSQNDELRQDRLADDDNVDSNKHSRATFYDDQTQIDTTAATVSNDAELVNDTIDANDGHLNTEDSVVVSSDSAIAQKQLLTQRLTNVVEAQSATLCLLSQLVDLNDVECETSSHIIADRIRDELMNRADDIRHLKHELEEVKKVNYSLESRIDQQAESIAQSAKLIERKDEQLDELENAVQSLETDLELANKSNKTSNPISEQNETALAERDAIIQQLEAKLEEALNVPDSIIPPPNVGMREEPEGSANEPISDHVNQSDIDAANKGEVLLLETKIAELSAENLEYVQRLSEIKTELVMKDKELEDLRFEHGRLKDDLTKLTDERTDLMKRIEESQHFIFELEQIRLLYKQLQDSYNVLENNHKIALEQIQMLESQIGNNSQNHLQEIEQLNEAMKRMSALVQDKDLEVQSQAQRITQLSAADESRNMEHCAENERLRTELDRLRAHLVSVEENYTTELMVSEAKVEEMVNLVDKLKAEQLEKETYEEQIRSLCTSRDKARNECSALEDKVQQYSTSIANLQAVIEQLEKEHERKLRSADVEHQAALEVERQQTSEILRKLQSQEERLRETMEALDAASRLTITIDQKEFQLNQLKREFKNKEVEIAQLNRKMVDLEASYEGKIDKQIVKSLLISYFATAPGTVARTEGERLLARFLDFNQQEMDRAGIKIGKSRTNQGGGGGNDSFTSMFVEFLETESNQGKEDVQSNKDRKLSTSSAHSFTNQASIELARDLNKRMNQSGSSSTTSMTRPNPFVPSGHNVGQSYHQRTPSTASSTSSTSMEHSTNQLFSGSQTAPIPPVYLGTTSGRKASSSGTSNIVDIVRGAVQPQDDQFI